MIIQSCVLFFSLLNGINPALTNAVIAVESGGNPKAVGNGRDFGLMQVRKSFVAETKQQLLNPCTNIMIGTKILRQAKDRCKHQLGNTWLVCYNRGIVGGRRVKLPKKDRYYLKVLRRMT